MKVIGKIIKGLLVVAFLMIVCVSGIFIYKGYNMYKNAVEEMSIEDKVNEIRAKENYTKIEELPEIYLLFQWRIIDFMSIGEWMY